MCEKSDDTEGEHIFPAAVHCFALLNIVLFSSAHRKQCRSVLVSLQRVDECISRACEWWLMPIGMLGTRQLLSLKMTVAGVRRRRRGHKIKDDDFLPFLIISLFSTQFYSIFFCRYMLGCRCANGDNLFHVRCESLARRKKKYGYRWRFECVNAMSKKWICIIHFTPSCQFITWKLIPKMLASCLPFAFTHTYPLDFTRTVDASTIKPKYVRD